ncbi:plexin-B-like isoform X3 [Dysidea avara]|uniref:plexin-B-like isoform X3 n=1 Tax=Dysidea avara TaxID=196820 RepID=UPI0033266E69
MLTNFAVFEEATAVICYAFNDTNSVRKYFEEYITTTSIISLQWSLGSDYVYGLTSEQVIPIPIEDCQSLRDCTSCAASRDPLCGWCSIEKKCSHRIECSNNIETRRWIQEEEMCIVNFAISPNTLPVELSGYLFNISAALIPPPLADESYYCVFGDLGSSVVEGNLIPGMDFTNLTCNYSFTVDQFSDGIVDTIVVDFSLRSDIGNINFITITDGFSFFNCSTHTSCSSCLSSDNLCGWCLYDKKCTSSSDQCRVVTDWINTRDNTNASCPLILNTTIGYQQPVGVSRNLSIKTENLPPPNSDYTYQCVIQYDGSQSVLQAEYTGPDGLVCVPVASDFSGVDYVSNGSVIIRWTGPDVLYDLETEIDHLNVILYDCSALAGGCSSCLSVSNTLMLDCGWCNSLTSCVIMESCSDGSTFTTISSTCPLPQITMVNPNSGPYQGGTDVTISGTDLGVVVDDIVFIFIGGSPCMINRDSYQPGERFRCTTTEHTILSPSYPSLIFIVIKRVGTTAFTSLPNGFRYANVSITGFYPEVIPISGNRMITITGINFDISNTSLVTVELAETACHIKSISHDSLQCVAGERRRRSAGPVVLRIDDTEIMSEDNFEYVDNPQVFSLRNNEVIKSGGVDLIFKGKQLNIIPTDLVIEIIDRFTGDSVMNYTRQCKNEVHNNDSITLSCLPYEHRKKLSCPFPGISSELFDGLKNGMLNLTYSLVATGVPNLSDLHLRPPLQLTVVDDPQFENFGTVEYSSDLLVKITGSLRGVQCNAIPCDTLMVIVGGVQGAECQIVNVTPFSLFCIPLPLTGTMPVTVHVGQYLNYTVGNIDYGTMDEGDKES